MKLFKYLLAVVLIVSISSCEKDNNIPINEPINEPESNFAENFGSTITAKFMGAVINEEGNPIKGATISVGSSMAITDVNGVFSVENASVFEKFAYITAKKDGFIDGSRALVPTDGVNQIQIL